MNALREYKLAVKWAEQDDDAEMEVVRSGCNMTNHEDEMRAYIEPGSELDAAMVALQSAIDGLMDPKYREGLINEARLSDYIGEVRDGVLRIAGYLREISEEAETQAETDRIFDRLGGFA